jgi:hypothetical protein
LSACGAAPEAEPGGGSLEAELARLPQDFHGRAAALDQLYSRFAGDPRLDVALREFEAANTSGTLKRMAIGDGRFASFVELEGGGAMFVEGGPRSLPSLINELGLQDAEPAELWRALFRDEPIPESLAGGTWASSAIDSSASTGAEEVTVDRSAEEILQPLQPFEAFRASSDGDIGTRREAHSLDGFLLGGGCAITPTPSGAAFGQQHPSSPHCPEAPSTGNGALALQSKEMRIRMDVFSGGLVNLQFSKNGTTVATALVQNHQWANHRLVNGTTCQNVCSTSWSPSKCGGAHKIPCRICTNKCSVSTVLWRVDVLNAVGDGYNIGGTWFNVPDTRPDTQPWQ